MKSELEKIPGVGPRIARRFNAMGIYKITDLSGKDPKDLYTQSCIQAGEKEDPCLLYVYRLAVYYASHQTPDPAKLKWWYWKDGR
ncbi:MAG: helix-hairpin-helix domain-containing protein [Oscillospiraceae bacterium]|nr:helix-hairpin-helix domain-containing protein [Oscillospiraceae bacterium]